MFLQPEFSSSPLHRLLALLMRTFAVGTFFGVHVRMYWTAAILMPLLFLQWVPAATFGERLLYAAIEFFGLFTIVWTHEMGHILSGERHGIRTDLITLSPLGGVAHMGAPAKSPREEILVSLAGPAVHLLWLAVVAPLYWLLPEGLLAVDGWLLSPVDFTLWYLVTVNTTMLVFNLLPFFPLDGGRVLRAVMALRMHANKATMVATSIGIGGAVVFAVMWLVQPGLAGSLSFVLALSCLSACLNERRVAQHALIYEQHRRDPWEVDGDAWKLGGDPRAAADERRPGWFTRWRRERAAKRQAAAAAEAAQLARDVDAALERVHQVGLGGLTERERQVLQRAAKQQRRSG